VEEFHRHGLVDLQMRRGHDEAHAAAARGGDRPYISRQDGAGRGRRRDRSFGGETDRDSSTDEQPRGEDRATMIHGMTLFCSFSSLTFIWVSPAFMSTLKRTGILPCFHTRTSWPPVVSTPS